jgi:hypothetical protein
MDLDAAKKPMPAAALSVEQCREIRGWLAGVFPVQRLCEILGLSRNTFYYQSREDAELDLREVLSTYW